ncbi:MAG: major capsid protein [Arizlama microvirus]|nr:MAG: major capsid protein [Arizlama microvirus]
MSNQLFKRTGGLNPGYSVFDLSYEKKFTCDMGQLIPVLCDEMVPGDSFTVGNQAVIRFQPMVAPVLHEINMFVHYFFVPYRLLWDDFEDFITRTATGDYSVLTPTWTPTISTIGSLWDFFGFPLGTDPAGKRPVVFPQYAYNYVYNEFYRDQTLQTPVALTQEAILNRNWEKDYFTSSLPFQQRGTAPALPISGTTSAVWDAALFSNSNPGGVSPVFTTATATNGVMNTNNANATANAQLFMNANTIDLSTATTFDIADLRLAFQIQKWMERNARAGARYTEFLKAHFGVSPKDDRLQRPEYVGGSKTPVIISEVLQTSSTDLVTPQGNLAGHGISVSNSYAGKYHAKEFGLMIGLMSVMPKPAYSQGVDKQWLRRSTYDFYFPEFANLSEQAIYNAEICAINGDTTHNNGIFGYQGRYDEMRIKSNMYCSGMRTTYNYWHMGREFDVGAPPILNDSFIECIPRKDIFAVPSEPGLIVSFGNVIKGVRPIPLSAEPGLIDHN